MGAKKDSFYLQMNKSQYLNWESDSLVKFTTGDKPVLFRMADNRGYKARFLVTGKVYFPVVTQERNGKTTDQYMYATPDPQEFTIQTSSNLDNRLFVYLPPGTAPKPAEYTYNCNLAGYFYIHGKTLAQSSVANFCGDITKIVKLINPQSQDCDILAKDCTSNCHNKLCSDDDDCGLPCGCTEPNRCLLSGECIDVQPQYREIITKVPQPIVVEVPKYPIGLVIVLLIFWLIIILVIIYLGFSVVNYGSQETSENNNWGICRK